MTIPAAAQSRRVEAADPCLAFPVHAWQVTRPAHAHEGIRTNDPLSQKPSVQILQKRISARPERNDRFGAGRRLAASGELAGNADLAQLQFGSPPERHFSNRTGPFRRSPPLAARHQTFKNHPLFVNTHFRVVHLDAVGHKENDGSMEVEIAWTLLLTIC